MLEELGKLINFIIEQYSIIAEEWKKSENFKAINMKKTLVKNLYLEADLVKNILNYRSFINEKNLKLNLQIENLELKSVVNTRVKAQNSIEFKINNYIKNHKEGEIPLNKCLNDLYGIRIIFNDDIKYNQIKEFIENRYCDLKCIDSSKNEGYVATHIYFKGDNCSFPWELQIWDKSHEMSNIISHEKYKQDYAKWEKENKGGGVLW